MGSHSILTAAVALALVAAGLALSPVGAAGTTRAAASTAATTAAASAPAASRRAYEHPPDMPKKVADALNFTRQERYALSDITDGTRRLDDDRILPLVLARVDRIPEFTRTEYLQLDSPPVWQIRKHPDDYRLRPLRLHVQVYEARELVPGKDIEYSKHWPRDRHIWQLTAVPMDTPDRNNNPLIIYCGKDMARQLGKPDVKHDNGVWSYHSYPRKLEVAAVFYKIYLGQSKDGTDRLHPVMLAWQAQNTFDSGSGSTWDSPFTGLIGIIVAVVLLGIFILWRWSKLRRDRAVAELERQRRRNRPTAFDDEETGPIDPHLKAAAEQYLAEHPEQQKAPPVKKAPAAQDAPVDGEVDAALRAAAEQYRKQHPEQFNQN